MGASSARTGQKKTESVRSSSSGWRIYFVLIVVCLFGGMAARSLFWPQEEKRQESAQKALEPPSTGQKLPPFTLMPFGQSMLAGRAYTNKDLEGHKTIFLIVKATCPHCVKECTWLSTYLPNLKGRASVVVASISPVQETTRFVADTGMTESMYLNAEPLARAVGIQAVPDLFLLDEAGTIRYFQQGELAPEKMKLVLETFLQGGDPMQIASRGESLQGGRA